MPMIFYGPDQAYSAGWLAAEDAALAAIDKEGETNE